MKSMTGYGKATVSRDGRELTLELKSVNHRFLDIGTKFPRIFAPYEDVIRNGLAKGGIVRGHVDVYINFTENECRNKTVKTDENLAGEYLNAAKRLKENFDLKDDLTLTALMRMPDVLTAEQTEEDGELLGAMLGEAVDKAATALDVMRSEEGKKLGKDISSRLQTVEETVKKISERAPKVAENYREKLTRRISEVLGKVEIDNDKLLNEVAFFVDKSNIDEEICRLSSHIDGAKEILLSFEPVGRKLDFLVQELNREANTVCSKSNDVELTGYALALKNEIEKIREQVQNLE